MLDFNLKSDNTSITNQSQCFAYQLSTFMLNNSKGDIYKICQGIVWYMFVLGSKHISRSAIAKFANCHIDTVSEANMRLEAAGIFGIFREYHKPNTYHTDFLNEIAAFFGYVNKFILSTTSLYLDKIKSKIRNLRKPDQNGNVLDGKLTNDGKTEAKFKKMLETLEIYTPVLCPLQEAIKNEAKSLQNLSVIAKLSLRNI